MIRSAKTNMSATTAKAADSICVFSEPHFDQRLVATITEVAAFRSGTVDPLDLGVENGPELYFAILRNMATSFRDCLAPTDGS